MAEPEQIVNTLEQKSESLKNNQKHCGYEGCDGIIEDYKCNVCGKAPLGGKRPGAGFPQGQKRKKTLEQMAVKRAMEQRILRHVDRLLNAQMNLAVGEQVLMVAITEGAGKDRKRRHEIVTDQEVIKQYLDWEEGIGDNNNPGDEDHFYYLSLRPSNNMALDSLLNRALGKAPDKLEVSGGFFNQHKLIVEVIGERQDPNIIDVDTEPVVPADQITEPGDTETRSEVEPETGPSTPTP